MRQEHELVVVVVGVGGGWKGRTQGGQNGILNRTGREGRIGIIEKLRGTKKREMDE